MATVYLGHDPVAGRDVAIKVLPHQLIQDADLRVRFQREARAVGLLSHPAIVQVLDTGEEDGQPYLVMEYMLGGSLADRLGRGPLPLDEVAEISASVCAALDAAHAAGVIHRDVKPANILFDADGVAHLADFGIARLAGVTQSLTHAALVGTPAYMSPEQCEGEHELTAASDVYSMGVVAYQMLAGRLPFAADSPFVVMRRHLQDRPQPPGDWVRLPPEVDAAVMSVLEKDPAKRPAAASTWANDLVAALDAGGAAGHPTIRSVNGPGQDQTAMRRLPATQVGMGPVPAPLGQPGSLRTIVFASIAGILGLAGLSVGIVTLSGGGSDPVEGSPSPDAAVTSPPTVSSTPTVATVSALATAAPSPTATETRSTQSPTPIATGGLSGVVSTTGAGPSPSATPIPTATPAPSSTPTPTSAPAADSRWALSWACVNNGVPSGWTVTVRYSGPEVGSVFASPARLRGTNVISYAIPPRQDGFSWKAADGTDSGTTLTLRDANDQPKQAVFVRAGACVDGVP